MDINEIDKQLQVEMELKNNKPVEDFEGRSPKEMHLLLHHPFSEESSMQFAKNIDDKILKNIPILKMTSHFLENIEKSQTIKLTPKGNLPVKIVKELYDLRCFPSEYIDSGFSRINSEEDFVEVHIMKLICELSGLIKKQKAKLSLTKKGKKLKEPESEYSLLKELFITYTTKFNWAYNDHYEEIPVGQLGFAFSLELLSKYGKELSPITFYANKYLKAFPILIEQIENPRFNTKEQEAVNCYNLRTFNYFMSLFGLAEIIEEGNDVFTRKTFIKKTEILDEFLKFAK